MLHRHRKMDSSRNQDLDVNIQYGVRSLVLDKMTMPVQARFKTSQRMSASCRFDPLSALIHLSEG